MTHLDVSAMNRAGTSGAWIAYHPNGSGFVVFATEIEALRHALANSMMVRYARYGDPDWQTRPVESTPEPPPYTLHNQGGVCRGPDMETR